MQRCPATSILTIRVCTTGHQQPQRLEGVSLKLKISRFLGVVLSPQPKSPGYFVFLGFSIRIFLFKKNGFNVKLAGSDAMANRWRTYFGLWGFPPMTRWKRCTVPVSLEITVFQVRICALFGCFGGFGQKTFGCWAKKRGKTPKMDGENNGKPY